MSDAGKELDRPPLLLLYSRTMVEPGAAQQLHQQIQHLTHENNQLRAQLDSAAEDRDRSVQAKKTVLKVGWSVLFPLFDRMRVVRNFMKLFATASAFTGPREHWPERENLVEDAKQFSLSLMRFAVRRRAMMLLLSLTAFVIPGIQILLVYKQNQIIETQNNLFKVEVYDIVARGLTSGTSNSKLITGALLAGQPDLVYDIIGEVFSSEGLGQNYQGAGGWTRAFEDAAVRGYLVKSLSRNLELQYEDGKLAEEEQLHRADAAFRLVVNDATLRVGSLMRYRGGEDNGPIEEVRGYLFSLVTLLRVEYKLAVSMGTTDVYFRDVAPLIARIASRAASYGDSPLSSSIGMMLQEYLLDLGQGLGLGEPTPRLGKEADAVLNQGFERLTQGVTPHAKTKWSALKTLMAVPSK